MILRALKAILRFFRIVIGWPIVMFGAFILPEDERQSKAAEVEAMLDEEQKSKPELSSVAFKDLGSYMKALETPEEIDGRAIKFVNQLKQISEKNAAPTRLCIILEKRYAPSGYEGYELTAVLSIYDNGRWMKAKDIEMNDASTIPLLIDETIEAAAQEGWSCMSDAAQQLDAFIASSLPVCEEYAEDRCRSRKITGSVRIQTELVFDVLSKGNKAGTPIPGITMKLITKIEGGSGPMESRHAIHFGKPAYLCKPAT